MKVKDRILLVLATALFLSSCSVEVDAVTVTTSVGKLTIIFEFIMALLPVFGGDWLVLYQVSF